MAWCISNQETTEVVTLLFQAIKKQSPDTQIRVLMTDDGRQNDKICNYKIHIHSCMYVPRAKCAFTFQMKSGAMQELQFLAREYDNFSATGMLTGKAHVH